MKLISWNINGIRAVFKKNFKQFLKDSQADIILLQEIKISEEKILSESFDFLDYQSFWFPAQRPGYSGTLTLYKKDLNILELKNGLGLKKFDEEGRVQTIELKDFLVNTYFPT